MPYSVDRIVTIDHCDITSLLYWEQNNSTGVVCCSEIQQCGMEMMRCVSEFGIIQQRFCEAEAQLKSLQQKRQKEIWQLLHRWSLEASDRPISVYHFCSVLYILWAFSVPQPSGLDIGSYLRLLLPSFPRLLQKSNQIFISYSFATWHIQSFLWLLIY